MHCDILSYRYITNIEYERRYWGVPVLGIVSLYFVNNSRNYVGHLWKIKKEHRYAISLPSVLLAVLHEIR